MKKKKQLRVKESASKEYKVKPKQVDMRPRVKRAFEAVYERNKRAWEELAKR